MAEEEQIGIKREELPYNPNWFFEPISKEDYKIASKHLLSNQKSETISISRLYRSRYSLDKLKDDISLPIYNEITKADAIFTVIGSSVGVNEKSIDELGMNISKSISDVCESSPDKKFLVITGGGRRGAMLIGQLANVISWVRNFHREKTKEPEKVQTNLCVFGVGPDNYTPEKISEHPEMPMVMPGPYFTYSILVDTSKFNGGEENAWPPTSEGLTVLPLLKRKSAKEVTIVTGGGATTEFEASNKLRFGGELIVIKGSGRFADLLFELKESLETDEKKLRPPLRALRYELESVIHTKPGKEEKTDIKNDLNELFTHIHWVDFTGKSNATNISNLTNLSKRLLGLS